MPDIDPSKSPAHRCKHGNDWLACGECDKASRNPSPDPLDESPRQWIIQRCINAFRNEYEDWPGYCERWLNRSEMMAALKACEERWPQHEFRGHNAAYQRPPSLQAQAAAPRGNVVPPRRHQVPAIGASGAPWNRSPRHLVPDRPVRSRPLRYVVMLGRDGAPPQLYDLETKSKVRPYATVAEAERQAILLNRLIKPGLVVDGE